MSATSRFPAPAKVVPQLDQAHIAAVWVAGGVEGGVGGGSRSRCDATPSNRLRNGHVTTHTKYLLQLSAFPIVLLLQRTLGLWLQRDCRSSCWCTGSLRECRLLASRVGAATGAFHRARAAPLLRLASSTRTTEGRDAALEAYMVKYESVRHAGVLIGGNLA